MLGQVRRRPQRLGLPFKIHLERPFLQRLQLPGFQLLVLDHLAEHDVAALGGALGVDHRVVVAGALEHADERGAFQHIQRVGRLVKVGAGRHVDAVGVIEKGHGVEIGLQNFVFGVNRLDLQRGDELLELARQAPRTAHLLGIQVARKLLRDGRAALGISGKGVQHRRSGALEIHAMVLIKTVILGGDQRGNHIRRDVGQLDPVAVAALEHRQFLAIGRKHHRRLLRLRFLDVPDAGRERNQHQDVQQQQSRHGSQRQGHTAPGGMAQAAQGFSSKGLDTVEEFFHRVPV